MSFPEFSWGKALLVFTMKYDVSSEALVDVPYQGVGSPSLLALLSVVVVVVVF